MPVILYSGTYRFLDPYDFASQPCHGIMLELAGSTVPLLVLQIAYSVQTARLQYLPFIGITVHLAQLLLAGRHWIAARHDPSRRLAIFHPGTCLELKAKMAPVPDAGQTLPTEPDGQAAGEYDLYLSTRKPRARPRACDTGSPDARHEQSVANPLAGESTATACEERRGTARAASGASPVPPAQVIDGLNWQFSAQRVYHQTVRLAKLSALYTLVVITAGLGLAWLLRDVLQGDSMALRFTQPPNPFETLDAEDTRE